jgi:hypothetical protein
MSFLFLAMFVGSVILYLLPWRIIRNLGVPFVPVRARFSFRLFPEDLERYQDLRYEEIFSSFPFYLIHDRRPKTTASSFPDNYFSDSREPCSSPVYFTNEGSGVLSGKTLELVPWDTVEFEVPEGVAHIGAKAFWKCTQLKRVTLPSTLVSIGEGAFAGCTSLKRIRIPDNVLVIGKHAFHGCTALFDVRMPANLAGLGYHAFQDCTSLKEIALPHTLRRCDGNAFAGCSALRSIDTFGPIPESFPAVDETLRKLLLEHDLNPYAAKFELPGSSTLKYASIPVGIQSVSFKNCIRLEEVVVARDASLEGFDGCLSLLRVRTHKQGRSGNPSPSVWGFGRCSFLREVELPDVVRIGAGAFERCVSLSRITLPESLEAIGDGAFEHCRSLEKIRIPAGVTYLGAGAFAEDVRLTEAEIAGAPSRIEPDVFTNCVFLTKCELADGMNSISDGMFSGCKTLREIRIPAGVKTIGQKAFSECHLLRNVEFPDGVESIGDNVFFATSLSHIELPASVKRIGRNAFGWWYAYGPKEHKLVFHGDIEDLDGIGMHWKDMVFPPDSRFKRLDDGTLFNSVTGRLLEAPRDTAGVFTVPENIRSIASNAFAGCTFDRIVVPDTVTHFEDGAFSACRAKELVLPDNMERVVDRMFEICSIPVITIPAGVKEIGAGAFRGCWNVRKVILPDGLERIGKEAFRGCHIREIDIPASVKWISKDAFPYSPVNQYVQEHYGHLMTEEDKSSTAEVPGSAQAQEKTPQ